MIASLQGRLDSLAADSVIINVGGVGFRVYMPTSALGALGTPGHDVKVYTHLHVREDDLSLYGFATEDELRLFEMLLTVSGIGPKVAMGVLSSAPSETLRAAIGQGNLDALMALPGIGKKTAQRLVLELKGKVDVTGLGDIGELSPMDEDVMNALINLGYSAAEATRAARSIPSNVKTVEDRVRIALQYLGGG